MTKKVMNAFYPPEEFYIFITYAPLGYGKSTYNIKVGVEILKKVYHLTDKEAWEKIKEFIVFHPRQFFQKITDISNSGYGRVPFINWEDMGLWLYALDWQNPFLEAFIKYLNVARTHLACLMGSTPSPEWVLAKLRRFPACYTVRIQKLNTEQSLTNVMTWKRLAVGFKFWLHADLKHSGVRKVFEDDFDCRMPNDFFEWYKPLRDAYEDLALKLLNEKWELISKSSKAILLDQYPDLNLPTLVKMKPTPTPIQTPTKKRGKRTYQEREVLKERIS